jgi:hypothetical protein
MFTLDDIHFWGGEGTNRCAVVVDWSSSEASPLVWGWRWNGSSTLADALLEIVREDRRLHALAAETEYGLSLYALGYDWLDVATSFFFDFGGGDVVAQASDPDALVAGGWNSGYWAQWVAPTGDSLDSSSLGWGTGLSATLLEDRSWHVLQFQRPEWGWDSHPLSGEPTAVESPYAWRVVAANIAKSGDYGNPDNALGHPSQTVPAWDPIPPTVVCPVSPAWGPGRLVSLASTNDDIAGGSITVEFDHPVADDPRNPFGLDFIVFGNTMQTLGGNAWFDGVSDPAEVMVTTDTIMPERGLVEVSADGKTWFAFSEGPWADDFAPTLSHCYDPDNPDRKLFGDSTFTNEWWSVLSDATRPVDPMVTPTDFKNRTLAEIARLYDGSAGGTGFDISGLDLPRDALGRKYMRFVRITSLDPYDTTEVDAVTDVSPAPSFRNWIDSHYEFSKRPDIEKTTICANGAPAYVNAALGLSPDTVGPVDWELEGYNPSTGILVAPLAPYANDLVFLQRTTNLVNGSWDLLLPVWMGTNTLGKPLLSTRNSLDAPSAAFFKAVLHE